MTIAKVVNAIIVNLSDKNVNNRIKVFISNLLRILVGIKHF